jgi:hypothetical protein
MRRYLQMFVKLMLLALFAISYFCQDEPPVIQNEKAISTSM